MVEAVFCFGIFKSSSRLHLLLQNKQVLVSERFKRVQEKLWIFNSFLEAICFNFRRLLKDFLLQHGQCYFEILVFLLGIGAIHVLRQSSISEHREKIPTRFQRVLFTKSTFIPQQGIFELASKQKIKITE